MINLTPKLKRNFYRILPFGIIWLIFGWAFLWTEYAVISVIGQQRMPESAIDITPTIVGFASLSVFFVGCFVGFMEVVLIRRLFFKSSLPQKIIRKFLLYAILMSVLIFVFYMLAASIEMKTSVFTKAVFSRYKTFFFSITNVSTMVQIVFSLIASLLYSEISDHLGHGVLLNFFTGKYHKPVVENRIFMFTDMKNSTSIAEQLGHVNYFEFLKNYYNNLSDAIINNHGEVYQYIGDEIVISWNLNDKNAVQNSVMCFFEMQKDLVKQKQWYKKTYGVFPEFKGALHSGEVTTGEIGALKKEIFFTGDVLNTTARMQQLCGKYEVEILISENLKYELIGHSNFGVVFVGKNALKGKTKPVELFTVVENTI